MSAGRYNRRDILRFVICAAVFLLLFWMQTLHVPYWQDDYYFLLDARQARLEGRSWLEPFFPRAEVPFWRPLGMETYWRFIETVLAGNVVAAHLANILLLVLAAASVGWLVATTISLLAPEKERVRSAVTAALLYGIHASHFLPAAWVSAANDSICVIFSAMALNFWLLFTTANRGRRWGAASIFILCTVLALLSRDIAFVLPPLGLLLALWIWPRYKPSLTALVVGALAFGISLAWLLVRNHFSAAVDPAYEMRFGTNVPRNAACLLLFFFNTPFEALRYFFFVRESAGFAAWGIAAFLLQLAAFRILLKGALNRLDKKGAVILAAFLVVGCAPYFLLNFNCYPYYTSIALIGYAILAGLASLPKRALISVLSLALLSSIIATTGNFFLDSPSHIGRARWAERQLVKLAALQETNPALFSTLHIVVEDNHRFQGFKREGLAYRLGIDIRKIKKIDPNDPEAKKQAVLVVPKEGDVYFKRAAFSE